MSPSVSGCRDVTPEESPSPTTHLYHIKSHILSVIYTQYRIFNRLNIIITIRRHINIISMVTTTINRYTEVSYGGETKTRQVDIKQVGKEIHYTDRSKIMYQRL
jgi:hypothetical protein